MKAAILTQANRIELEERPIPELAPGDALLRLEAASICGTDLRIAKHGHFKLPAGERRVLGHEFAGQVVAVDGDAPGLDVGMRVAVAPNVGCGHCDQCRSGRNNMCPAYEAFGVSWDGGFQEFMRIPARAVAQGNALQLPDTIPADVAPLVEPLSCCVHGADHVGVGSRDTVLVLGAGPIGSLHAQLARARGARRVLVANRSQPKLDVLRGLGVDATINTSERNLIEAVAELTDGDGVDVVFIAASSPQLQTDAVQVAATHGRISFFSGLGYDDCVPLDTNRIHYRALTLTGTTGSSLAAFAHAIDLAAEGRVDLKRLVTGTYSLDAIWDAFDHAA
jgi:L-iditol 2-dehydrogenase